MAKVKPSIMEESGTIGDRVYYTRFGRTFSRRRPETIKDKKSKAQLRQRALFKAVQHTASLLGSAIQRGLAKEAHKNCRVENNEFANLNKQRFSYENGTVIIDYPRLILSTGLVGRVEFLLRNRGGQPKKLLVNDLHVELSFDPCLGPSHSRPDDVVHIYAVEFNVEVCELVASVKRCESRAQSNQDCSAEMQRSSLKQLQSGIVAFDLPDLSEETSDTITFHLYAIVEAAKTACIPTLSPYEKKSDKNHRNIDRQVSQSIYIGSISYQ